jgi:hypothetical protein
VQRWFPHLPEEVYEIWLKERIEGNGWPPKGGSWTSILAGKSSNFWHKLRWEKQELELAGLQFGSATQLTIKGLRLSLFFGVKNNYSGIYRSKERASDILNYIKRNSSLPGVMIFVLDQDVYDAVEGCHRLAVYFHLKQALQPVVWPIPRHRRTVVNQQRPRRLTTTTK